MRFPYLPQDILARVRKKDRLASCSPKQVATGSETLCLLRPAPSCFLRTVKAEGMKLLSGAQTEPFADCIYCSKIGVIFRKRDADIPLRRLNNMLSQRSKNSHSAILRLCVCVQDAFCPTLYHGTEETLIGILRSLAIQSATLQCLPDTCVGKGCTAIGKSDQILYICQFRFHLSPRIRAVVSKSIDCRTSNSTANA